MKKAAISLLFGSIIITFFLFFPFSSNISRSLPNSVDPLFYAWNLAHNVQSASHGFSDLLDTNIFFPETNTLAFSDTLYAQTLLTAPIIVLTKNPVLAENIYILATFPLAAVTMFFLSYYLTGHAWASALSGLFYAFSYPRMAQIGHMPALSSQWLPLCFLYLIKYLREGSLKDLIMLLFWYILSIASTMYFGIFFIPLAFIIFFVELTHMPRTFMLRSLRHIAIIAIPALVVLVVILFPYLRLRAEYPGIRRSLEDSARLSAMPIDYLSILPSGWLGNLGFPVNINEHSLFPTITLLSLTILSIAIVDRKNRKMVFAFAAVAITAFLLSFGPYMDVSIGTTPISKIHMPYYYLYKIFPLLQSIRVPARLSIFVILALSVCSAFALSKILKTYRSVGIGLVVALLFLAEVWQTNVPFVPVPTLSDVPPVYIFLAKTPGDFVIVEVPFHRETTGNIMEHQVALTYDDVSEQDVFAMEAYRTYFSAFHNKKTLNGYSGYFPNIFHDHADIMNNFPSQESVELLQKIHIRYILVHGDEYVSVAFSDVQLKIGNFPSLKMIRQFGNDYVYELDTAKM